MQCGAEPTLRRPRPAAPPQRQQQRQQQQILVRRAPSKMPSIVPASAAAPPRTVVVGDMVVADDDSDSEGDVGRRAAVHNDDGDDTDEDARPKVLRVITRNTPTAGAAARAPEPSWHALLRRTPSSRTASIACTVPRGSMSQPPRPATPRSRIIRADANHRPGVVVPAKVLVPRTRLMFPLVTRGRAVVPVGRQGLGQGLGQGRPLSLGPVLYGPGTLVRREAAGPGAAAAAPRARIVVSAKGPLSRAENAVLDGALDLLAERVPQPAGGGRYRPARGELSLPDEYQPRDFNEYIRNLMHWFSVSGSDVFSADLRCVAGCCLCPDAAALQS